MIKLETLFNTCRFSMANDHLKSIIEETFSIFPSSRWIIRVNQGEVEPSGLCMMSM